MAQREGGFDEVGTYGSGDVLTSPTLEGFTVDLDEIFQARRAAKEA